MCLAHFCIPFNSSLMQSLAHYRCSIQMSQLKEKKVPLKPKKVVLDIQLEVVRQLYYLESPKSMCCIPKVLWDDIVNVRKKKIPKPQCNSRTSVCWISSTLTHSHLGETVHAPATPLDLLWHMTEPSSCAAPLWDWRGLKSTQPFICLSVKLQDKHIESSWNVNLPFFFVKKKKNFHIYIKINTIKL